MNQFVDTVCCEMSINKFGISLEKNGTATAYYQYSGLIRNYVRANALCMTAIDFDAKSRKIKHVAQPEDDSDAVNKQYVETSVKIFRDQQKDYERRILALEKDVHSLQIMIHEIQKALLYTAESAHSSKVHEQS